MNTSRVNLIAGLPTDVPGALCHLLLHLDVTEEPTIESPSPSIAELATILHESEMTVRRIIAFGADSGILDVDYVFNQAGKKIGMSRHTKREIDFKGQIIGQVLKPNWIKITELQKSDVIILNTPNAGSSVHIEHTAGVSGRGIGKERENGGDSPLSALAASNICVLAQREITKRWHEAQEKHGIPEHRQYDPVHGKQDRYTLLQLIRQMEPKGFWTSYMRVVNLFSFWVEHHPTKNLKSVMAVFKAQHKEWIVKLREWEETATEEFRVIVPTREPEEPIKARAEKTDPTSDPRVVEMIREVYAATGLAPDAKKVAKIIAAHDFDYLSGALNETMYDDNNEGKTGPAQIKATKTFFTEGGALALISAYQSKALYRAARYLVEEGGGTLEAAEKMCRQFSAKQVIALSYKYEQKRRDAAKKGKS